MRLSCEGDSNSYHKSFCKKNDKERNYTEKEYQFIFTFFFVSFIGYLLFFPTNISKEFPLEMI